MRYLPVVDESLCVAHGDCADLAPEAFVVEETAEVVAGGPPERLIAAAEACPAGAIAVYDTESEAYVYP